MEQASLGFTAGNAGSGLLEFSPPRPAHGSIACGSRFQSISSFGSGANGNSNLRSLSLADRRASIARKTSDRRNSVSSTHFRSRHGTHKPSANRDGIRTRASHKPSLPGAIVCSIRNRLRQ